MKVSCADRKFSLAAVLDCFDDNIQGFHIANHMQVELCVEAFDHACQKFGSRGMLLHSDRGSQFSGSAFRAALKNVAQLRA